MSGTVGDDMVDLARELPLFGAVARVARRAVRRHAALPPLPEAQVQVLRAVEANPGIGTGAVAERLQLVPNTVSTIVGELVQAGLLSRERAAGDRRVGRLSLTPAAEDALRLWGAARDEVISAALRRLDDADRRAIAQALPAMRRLLALLDVDEPGQDTSRSGTTTGQPAAGSRTTTDSTP
ncbi:MarR family winged helix-turn-helix transcriptional regulator [Micromonospora sp. NPDC049679]|uniref:MarR family winged helix-turn-helix transcriptional regulator n=1 Tax=Micromonospora sp. NPDC049679 TaxID=3155920 RepID=UPI0033D04F87